MVKDVEVERLPDIELPTELDAKVTKLIEEADREDAEARVNFRWGKAQVDTVKRAAEIVGVPRRIQSFTVGGGTPNRSAA